MQQLRAVKPDVSARKIPNDRRKRTFIKSSWREMADRKLICEIFFGR